MALSASTVLEVRLTGSDTNGGGFVTGASGTDWSQQDTAQYSVTDGVTAGTTTITSATAAFGTDVVGNLIYVQGGTGSVVAGWYQIITRTNATTIVVDRSTGLTAGTGVTLHIGGALLSPGQAAAIATVAFQTVFIKYNASPYVITTASTNVSGGVPVPVSSTAYIGYNTTRAAYNLDALRPTIQLQAGVTGTAVFMGTNNTYFLHSVILDANSQTGSRCGFQSGEFFNVKGMNGVTGGLNQNVVSGRGIFCEVTGCVAVPLLLNTLYYCSAHDNTLTVPTNVGAIGVTASGMAYGCISYNNNCDGFGPGNSYINCVAYNDGGQGFNAVNTNLTLCVNCIAENNTLFGFRTNTATISLINCASFNNTSGRFSLGTGKLWGDINPITGSGSFFTSAATDFTLNNTAGAGALLRATGFPATFPVPANNNYKDVGALQHLDSGSGSTGISRARGASGF